MAVSLSKWSFDVNERGIFINGVTGKGAKQFDFHTGILKQGTERDVTDEQGGRFKLEGPHDTKASLANGLSQRAVDACSRGLPSTWKRLLRQEQRCIMFSRQLLDVDWRDLTPIGIEAFALAQLRQSLFEFPHLHATLVELAGRPYPLYAFMGSQPCLDQTTTTVHQVPYIVVIDCAVAPPDKLAYHSLQAAKNQVLDMASTPSFARFEWVPYVPHSMKGDLVPRTVQRKLFTLQSMSRRARYERLTEAQQHYVEYLHPYIFLPHRIPSGPTPVINVHFEWPHDGHSYVVSFDKEVDRLATFIPAFLEENSLPDSCHADVEAAIRQAFKDKRAVLQQEYDDLVARAEAMSSEDREALRNMKLYKFYPSHPELDVSPFAVAKVNQYFGDATHVMLPNAS